MYYSVKVNIIRGVLVSIGSQGISGYFWLHILVCMYVLIVLLPGIQYLLNADSRACNLIGNVDTMFFSVYNFVFHSGWIQLQVYLLMMPTTRTSIRNMWIQKEKENWEGSEKVDSL